MPDTQENAPPAVDEHMNRNTRDVPVELGTGNVFEDLGFPNAEERLAKVTLSRKIDSVIEERGLAPTEAARILELSRSDVSDIVRGKLEGSSIERLCRCLVALGQDVEITVREKPLPRTRAYLTVTAA